MIGTLVALALALAGAPDDPSPVGDYDGSRREMVARLSLGEDGRFRYAVSLGGLDEEADGAWRIADGRVLLTSDPVTRPAIDLVEQAPGPRGRLRVVLDMPQGGDPQFFDVRLDGNRPAMVQMGTEGRDIELSARQPVRVTMTLG
ncbi:MAG TPA: hypothetical protein VNR91_02380, partial [Sphingomonas sp.]|nr:hypothetical protein [Sphingomonas sp.]